MNQIASLLPLDNVVANLDASSKKRIFEQVGILFENHQGLARSAVYDALFAREKLGSTGSVKASRFPMAASRGSRRRSAPSCAWSMACLSTRRTASRSA
jgi:PTS system nitrogen regulatory IIA component